MKNHFVSLSALFATTALLAAAGCSDHAKKEADPIISPADTATATEKPGLAVTPATESTVKTVAPATAADSDPFADIALALSHVTRDTAAGLAGPQEGMNRLMDAQIASWKAKGATNTLTADEKLSLARTDFTQKVSALSLTDEETWKTAKTEALDSLENLRRAYHDYLAGPVKN